MAQITLKGFPINTVGELPRTLSQAPGFSLTKTDLGEVSLKDYSGKKVILNIFPSLDTTICALSVRRFNGEVEKLDNTVILCVSLDLPFAHERFCSTQGLKNVIPLSDFRDRFFGEAYGVRIVDGPLRGLLSRAVVVIDEKGTVIYTEQVPEITQEPAYDAVLKVVKA